MRLTPEYELRGRHFGILRKCGNLLASSCTTREIANNKALKLKLGLRSIERNDQPTRPLTHEQG